jgi:hypothetical protein
LNRSIVLAAAETVELFCVFPLAQPAKDQLQQGEAQQAEASQ